ncbi:MAG: glutamate-1-semialdehyde 2,1-aminomutase [Actinobacteria bacterium]|nr:glutamate-1-semialdehyde 2,1-aminomutase [Actinomycetota bacterium]
MTSPVEQTHALHDAGLDSEILFASAGELMPGGVSSPVRAFGSVGGTPLFISSAQGPHLTDASGRTYIDMLGSWGPMIKGHAHADVVRAIVEAASRGTSYGAPSPHEVHLAQTIVGAIDSIEMVRFVSSGTEASMSALRLARAATGRDKILKFEGCYHGHVDSLLVAAGSGPVTAGLPDSPGVTAGTRQDTLVCRFNDIEGVERAFADHGNAVAAVIVEPIAANMGVVHPAEGFLSGLRRLCDSNGSLLIFDEVITGFRVDWRGAQHIFGVKPDLTILGKVIGGGMPVGAYGGRRDLMRSIAPAGAVYQAGTLSGNPVSMAAGLATLEGLDTDDSYDTLESRGAALQEGLTAAARRTGIDVVVQRQGSMLTVFFSADPVTNLASAKRSDTSRFAAFFHSMLDAGVYWPPSQFEAAFISTAHLDQNIDEVIDAASYSFERIGS